MEYRDDYGLSITPFPVFGASLEGLDLSCSETITDELKSLIRGYVTKYKVLVIKKQGIIPHERHIEITNWFGEVECAGFEQHVKSPDRRLLIVSNDENEGYRDFGIAGFHIDGSFMENPNAYSLYHIISVPSKGSTLFVSLNDVYENLRQKQKRKWEQLWMVKTFKRIRGHQDCPGYVIHPLVYNHPVTNKKTLCISLGKTNCFIWNKGSKNERKTHKDETKEILQEIENECNRENKKFQYCHQWEAGDFIISDNLAVGHMASPETQLLREEVGLRIMHRTVVRGTNRPEKIKQETTFNKKLKCSLS